MRGYGDDEDGDRRCCSIRSCLRYTKILLMTFGLGLQSWARRMRRQRNHLQLWTPLCLILWTIVYICMAWEYESWKNMRNGIDGASLLQDGSGTTATCDCGGGGGAQGLVAYVEGERVRGMRKRTIVRRMHQVIRPLFFFSATGLFRRARASASYPTPSRAALLATPWDARSTTITTRTTSTRATLALGTCSEFCSNPRQPMVLWSGRSFQRASSSFGGAPGVCL